MRAEEQMEEIEFEVSAEHGMYVYRYKNEVFCMTDFKAGMEYIDIKPRGDALDILDGIRKDFKGQVSGFAALGRPVKKP